MLKTRNKQNDEVIIYSQAIVSTCSKITCKMSTHTNTSSKQWFQSISNETVYMTYMTQTIGCK